MKVRRTQLNGERRRRPTRKALALVAAGAVVFGLAMIAPAAGSALGVAAAVVAVMPSDRRGGKGATRSSAPRGAGAGRSAFDEAPEHSDQGPRPVGLLLRSSGRTPFRAAGAQGAGRCLPRAAAQGGGLLAGPSQMPRPAPC